VSLGELVDRFLHLLEKGFRPGLPLCLMGFHLPSLVVHLRIGHSVVGRVPGRVVSQLLQHRGNITHAGNQVVGKTTHPGCQGSYIDRLDNLVRAPFSVGDADTMLPALNKIIKKYFIRISLYFSIYAKC